MKILILASVISALQIVTAQQSPVIFLSSDNGATWRNGSAGIPSDARIGLGAIAVSKNMMGVSVKRYGIYLFNSQSQRWTKIPTDQRIINANPAALFFHNNTIYAGTQSAGVFTSKDNGRNWQVINKGLRNMTIRRFTEIDNKLYVGTNGGLYSYEEQGKQWILEYGDSTLQVNGAAFLKDNIYIATNKGAFHSRKGSGKWLPVLKNKSLHNISADGNTVYAMTYNELFSSGDGGFSWQSIQKGLPPLLYTFNVVANGGEVFAGQWDGFYRRDEAKQAWAHYGSGLPPRFALTNMKVYNGMIVVSGGSGKAVATFH